MCSPNELLLLGTAVIDDQAMVKTQIHFARLATVSIIDQIVPRFTSSWWHGLFLVAAIASASALTLLSLRDFQQHSAVAENRPVAIIARQLRDFEYLPLVPSRQLRQLARLFSSHHDPGRDDAESA